MVNGHNHHHGGSDRGEALEALRWLDPSCSREEWVELMAAAKKTDITPEEFDAWSSTGSNYAGTRDVLTVWRSLKGDGITERTLFKRARQNGWRPLREEQQPIQPRREQAGQPRMSQQRPQPAPQRATGAAAAVWARCIPATAGHPYIAAKSGIPDGLRVVPDGDALTVAGLSVAGCLVVPGMDGAGNVLTLQFVAAPDVAAAWKAAGKPGKLNLPGQMDDARFVVGAVEPGGTVYVCEGIGQAWACWRATGRAAVVTFGFGRTRRVAQALRQQVANATLVLVPDAGKEGEAQRIATEVGAVVATMPEGSPPNFDACDFAQQHGADELAVLLEEPAKAVQSPQIVLTVGELFAHAGSLRWAVKGIIPEQGIGFAVGASQSLKTFVMLDYALHRAYGMPWMGRRTKQAVPVYLAAEGGAGLMRRIQAWHKARGMDWRACPMRVVVVPLTLRTQARLLQQAIEAAGVRPGDVIVDTMSQTYTGNENSNDEVADWLRTLGVELRDHFRCAVTIVHHTGHAAADRARGASSIGSNTDYVLVFQRDGRELLTTVEFQKVKDDATPEPQTFALGVVDLGRDEDGDPITSLAARHVASPEDVARAHQYEASRGRGGRLDTLMRLVHPGMAEKELRRAFYEALDDVREPDAKKVAFYRARDAAMKAGFIDIGGADRRLIVLREYGA